MICPLILLSRFTAGNYNESQQYEHGPCLESNCAWWCGGVCVMVKLAQETAKIASRLPKQ